MFGDCMIIFLTIFFIFYLWRYTDSGVDLGFSRGRMFKVFKEIFDHKIVFFWLSLPPKISMYSKGGPFWSAGGQIH